MSDYAHPQQIETRNLYYNDPSCSTAMENCSDENYLERNGYNKSPTERSENYDPKLSCIIDNPCYHDRSKSVALDQASDFYASYHCDNVNPEDKQQIAFCNLFKSREGEEDDDSQPTGNPCTDNNTKDQILEAYMKKTIPKGCSQQFMEDNFGDTFRDLGTFCGLAQAGNYGLANNLSKQASQENYDKCIKCGSNYTNATVNQSYGLAPSDACEFFKDDSAPADDSAPMDEIAPLLM